ncbi:related to choline dehydrogenase [Phialocephala subalpina]|uniref:Related to choline dehydrogenase n=1 Tax=Phialocephala subalpina TaxID=576137 RepID=A0A1L7X104_9HELO|nr:related to choline dehydrogenase [Phialocephala subalpina]
MAYLLKFVLALQGLSVFSFVIAATDGEQPRDVNFIEAQNQTYDYIIVGGGLSGLVVANRLSEDPSKSVLVIENGYIDDGPATSIPYMATILNVADMYNIFSAPEPYLNNLSVRVAVGNVVGGGSVVNGMFWDRGSNADYDAWETLGNKGWGWAGLAPYFKKTNTFTPPSESTTKEYNITYDKSAYGNGPVQVTIPSFQDPDIKNIFDAFKAENISNPQEGYADPIGVFWGPNDIDNATATRCHARVAFYDPVQSRPNLRLLTGTRVNQILFENIQGDIIANGIQMVSRVNGSIAKVHANREVILAACGVFTPHLLMLSGIGPKGVLEAANITVVKDSPGVGSNFQDHPPLSMSFNLSNMAFPNSQSLNSNASFNASAAAQYAKDHTGPWSAGRGSANPIDKEILSELVRYNRRRWSSPLLSHYNPVEITPGANYTTDDEIIEGALKKGALSPTFAHPSGGCAMYHGSPSLPNSPTQRPPEPHRQRNPLRAEGALKKGALSPTFAHPSGGCAMMPEELGGVVDDELRVYGARGLRIVDASIIPLIPATHLQATMYAVAEKAADIIKARAAY